MNQEEVKNCVVIRNVLKKQTKRTCKNAKRHFQNL